MYKGFYSLNTEELKKLWEDEKTIFVFDTNVLLNLYGYAKQTRDDFFKIVKTLDRRVWIPYQVGLEYQCRRLNVIKKEKGIFNDIEDNLKKISQIFEKDFEKLELTRRFPKLAENTKNLENDILKIIESYKESVKHRDSEQPCVRSHDTIRRELNECFEGKVGSQPENQEWLDKIYSDGEERFKKKIPPGFKDSGKSSNSEDTHFYYNGLHYERQYGDLIIWKQLIFKANNPKIEGVIFITDDLKEDWWYKLNSNGNKIIGPLAELQAEIFRESNIINFHMYRTSTFLKDGNSNLSVKVEESSIEDANFEHATGNQSVDNESMEELMQSLENIPIDGILRLKSAISDN